MIRRLLAVFALLAAGDVPAQFNDTSLWIPNGPVHAVLLRDSALFVGGDFSQVSPPTGHFVILDDTTAAVQRPFPLIDGRVNCMARDSAGRLYVGGFFSKVGSYNLRNLFRLDAQGNIDLSFQPDPDGEIFCLEVYSDRLWIGGGFQSIGGFPRMNGACYSIIYPAPDTLTDFDPLAYGPVYALLPDDAAGVVYAGGDFIGIGGCPATYCAKLLQATGHYVGSTFWQCIPNPNGPVRAMGRRNHQLYIAGDFTALGATQRKGLVALDDISGIMLDVSNSASDYDAGLNGTVNDLLLLGDKIYIAGHFSVVNTTSRNNLACLDTLLNVLPWVVNANDEALCIVSGGDSLLYLGGKFRTLDGDTAYYAGVADTAGNVRPWNAWLDGAVLALMPRQDGDAIFAGGGFAGAGGVLRENLCAIDLHTKRPDGWRPLCNDPVRVLFADSANLYLAGDFTMIGAAGRNRIAAFRLDTRALTAFNPGVNGLVRTMTGDGGNLYLGGNFSVAGGQSRSNIACIDIATSQATAWNPGCSGTVNKLILDHQHLYVGGFFSQIGSQPRDNTARLSTASSLAEWGWSCNTDDGVFDLELYNGGLYMGGWFTNAGGQPRQHLAAADTLTGALLPFSPGTDDFVLKLARWNDDLFISGPFSSVGPSFGYSRLCNYDLGDGLFGNWSPLPDPEPVTLFASQDWLFIGGSFTSAGGAFHPNLSMLGVQYITGMPVENAKEITRVWPNPASTEIFVLWPAGKKCTMQIIDVTGRVVMQQDESGTLLRVNVEALSPGLYSILIFDGEQRSSARFVRE